MEREWWVARPQLARSAWRGKGCPKEIVWIVPIAEKRPTEQGEDIAERIGCEILRAANAVGTVITAAPGLIYDEIGSPDFSSLKK